MTRTGGGSPRPPGWHSPANGSRSSGRRIEAGELASDEPEAEISISLGRGAAGAHVYFSDLTHEYIRINAEYTT